MTRNRKRPRDAEATRAALLERATREFADRGYDGARVDEIAEAAGINKRMIYAYFGDKEGLYRAVLDACLAQALDLAHEGLALDGAVKTLAAAGATALLGQAGVDATQVKADAQKAAADAKAKAEAEAKKAAADARTKVEAEAKKALKGLFGK